MFLIDIIAIDIDTNDDDLSLTSGFASSTSSFRSKKRSYVWDSFSNNPEVTTLRKAKCKHCQQMVTYEKKVDRVKCHLKKCQNFQESLRK